MSYTYDFETRKNLSHKQSVLFYGPSRSLTVNFDLQKLMILEEIIVTENISRNQPNPWFVSFNLFVAD